MHITITLSWSQAPWDSNTRALSLRSDLSPRATAPYVGVIWQKELIMTQNELAQIITCLEKSGAKGISLASLAISSGIDSQSLYSYLSKYSDYFVQLPESKKYKVNGFGRFKGDSAKILQHHRKSLKNQRVSSSFLFFILSVAVFTSMMVVISNAT